MAKVQEPRVKNQVVGLGIPSASGSAQSNRYGRGRRLRWGVAGCHCTLSVISDGSFESSVLSLQSSEISVRDDS